MTSIQSCTDAKRVLDGDLGLSETRIATDVDDDWASGLVSV